jgi:lipid A 3-O-deacylase
MRNTVGPCLALLLLVLRLMSAMPLNAQESPASSGESPEMLFSERPIEAGIFGGLGTAIADRIGFQSGRAAAKLNFANAGFRFGKVLSMPHGPAFVRSQFEWSAEFMPFWLASYPHQTLTLYSPSSGGTASNPYFGYDIRGFSLTPAQLRLNFAPRGRFVPWAQIACGVLWTERDFPLIRTSDVNFTPQFGLGTHLFTRPRQSIDFSVNAVHISNGNTADANPGVNVTIQASVGYSWWGAPK